jgi:quinoprotein glucose dehydrogenase
LKQNRGVAWWPGGRIFFGTLDGSLVALDAKTGQPCRDFGENGRVNLRTGVADAWPRAAYALNSPPAIYRDLVIVGVEVPEGQPVGPSGMVRAFEARTGKEVWRFHTIPGPGNTGHDTWEGGSWRDRTGANAWSMMSVDERRGLVFVPTGSASYDFYGGDRGGANLFANSLIALDAGTGKRVWHYQLIHHDIWDYDYPRCQFWLG